MNRVQIGEAPQLLKVSEGGEFKRGSITESKESYRIETYGRVVGITRQVLINDDLDAFTRIPAMYGTAIATLDLISNGRVIIGTGAGYLAPEFAAVGGDFDQRNDVTDESIRAMKAIWSGEPVTMSGLHFEAVETIALPLPVQLPSPPIWIGGNSNRAIRRSVELADGWNPMPSPARASRMLRTPPIETIEDLERRIGDLGAASEKAGREIPPEVIFTPIGYDLFSGSFPDAAKFVDDIAAYSAIGVSTLTINLPGDTRAQWIESVEWLGSEVIANIDA